MNEIIFGVSESTVKGKPNLTLKVKMLNKSGEIIWQDHIVVRSKEWVVIDEKWLWGVRYMHDVAGKSAIQLTKEAVEQLVDKNI